MKGATSNQAAFAEDPGSNCLVLSMRHMGDAVILSGVVNALQTRYPSLSVDILGRPGLEVVSRSFSSFRDYFGIDLPVYGHHRRESGAMRAAIGTIRQIRRRKYECCINTIGDVRENLISRLTGARISIAPVWEPGHLFKRKMTDTGAWLLPDYGVRIPSSYTSYYDSLQFFVQQLGMTELSWNPIRPAKVSPPSRRVALHPGASHPSRHWPAEKWRSLIQALWHYGCELTLLGSAAEREALMRAFGPELATGNLKLVTDEIPQFMASLAASDLVIGMDSFSVHAAFALGVPAVVLNGSADARILTPPGSLAVSAGHLCGRFPCYYSFPCQGTDAEFVCVRGIEPESVIEAMKILLEQRDGNRALCMSNEVSLRSAPVDHADAAHS